MSFDPGHIIIHSQPETNIDQRQNDLHQNLL